MSDGLHYFTQQAAENGRWYFMLGHFTGPTVCQTWEHVLVSGSIYNVEAEAKFAAIEQMRKINTALKIKLLRQVAKRGIR